MAENRPLAPGMRRLLWAATVLVLLAGVPLFVVPERTAEWFAWTVEPPVTAAFLGAAYWASATVELTSARARSWADARVAVPGVLAFTALTFVVTLVHLDRFHLAADLAPGTRAVAWAWVGIYAVVPLLLLALWWRQATLRGTDPRRARPLPGWVAVGASGVAAVLLAYGTWLLLDPVAAAGWWPWELTPLTGRAVGAWLVGLGVSAAHAVWEGDTRRSRPVAVGALALSLLVAAALLRYPDAVDIGTPQGVGLVAAVVVWAALGAAILRAAARRPPGALP